MSWRQTGGCDPNGPRESHLDKNCDAIIPNDASGYCECKDGQRKMHKACIAGSFKTCNDACKGQIQRLIFVRFENNIISL